jgi:hypothetical protein
VPVTGFDGTPSGRWFSCKYNVPPDNTVKLVRHRTGSYFELANYDASEKGWVDEQGDRLKFTELDADNFVWCDLPSPLLGKAAR